MHEGWSSGMVAREGNHFIVQSLHLNDDDNDEEETLEEYVQSTKLL